MTCCQMRSCEHAMNTTTSAVKRMVRAALAGLGLSQCPVTARTVSCSDLARDSCIVARAHHWPADAPGQVYRRLEETARQHGFLLEVYAQGDTP
jgi:hypothetical protein